jgi:Fe-S-cluster containining protein
MPNSDQVWLLELEQLYARIDAIYADWSCPSSTDCCRFGVTGRQPYVTSIELLAIRRALALRGGSLEAHERALPLLPVLRDSADERICPLLDRDQRCSVYADRPLGCRSFYCGRATRGAGPTDHTLLEIIDALRALAARHRLGGEIARPLLQVLELGFAG